MENGTNILGTDGLWGVIIFLIIAGIIGGNGLGFGGNRTDITNEFMYNQLANQLRDNNNAINLVNNQVLENKYALDKEIMQNRFDSQLAFANSNSMMQNCCCTLRQEASENTQKILDAINNNRIADLEYQLNQANTAISNSVQTSNILNTIGQWYSKPSVNPYYAYTNGTTLI